MIIGQGQCLSFIAYHLIRFWPDPMPPHLENILTSWYELTKKDFDTYDQQELLFTELKPYFKTTLEANSGFRYMINKDGFFYNEFLSAIVKSIDDEIKELKE